MRKKDDGLEEIDSELRDIDSRLKKVLSRTDALLKTFQDEPAEGDPPAREDEHAGEKDKTPVGEAAD